MLQAADLLTFLIDAGIQRSICSLVVAAFANVSAFSLPGIPTWAGTQTSVIFLSLSCISEIMLRVYFNISVNAIAILQCLRQSDGMVHIASAFSETMYAGTQPIRPTCTIFFATRKNSLSINLYNSMRSYISCKRVVPYFDKMSANRKS